MITRGPITAGGAATVILSLAPAPAAEIIWVGDTSGDWNTGTEPGGALVGVFVAAGLAHRRRRS